MCIIQKYRFPDRLQMAFPLNKALSTHPVSSQSTQTHLMQDTIPFFSNTNSFTFTHNEFNFPSLSRPNSLHFPIFSLKTITPPPSHKTNISDFTTAIALPQSPPPPPPSPKPTSAFKDKMLYLDSMGLDSFSLVTKHPPIVLSPLHVIKSTIDYLAGLNFTSRELTRVISMCPETLASNPSALLTVITFLLREARVNGCDLKRVINRRPRLLVCSVKTQLRPTLYFLQSIIGISEVNRHTYLLSCSVEDKFIPRIEFFEDVGFSHKESVSMFRRFPQLFNYSVEDNLKAKMDYFVVEIGGELKELKEFPQYFSFSLENRIKPRHQRCVDKGVCFPLRVLLKTNEAEFRNRLLPYCNPSILERDQ